LSKIIFLLSAAVLLVSFSADKLHDVEKHISALKYAGLDYFYPGKSAQLLDNLRNIKLRAAYNETAADKKIADITRQINKIENRISRKTYMPLCFSLSSGAVSIKSQKHWRRLSAGGLVFQKRYIKTDTAAAFFKSSAGSSINMYPASLIYYKKGIIAKKNDNVSMEFNVLYGDFLFDFIGAGDDVIKLKAQKAVFTAANAAFTLKKRADTVAATVFEGKLDARINNKNYKISPGRGIIFNYKGRVTLDTLPSPPKFINPRKKYVVSPAMGLRLKWTDSVLSNKYYLEIYSSPDRSGVILRMPVQGTGVELPYTYFNNGKEYYCYLSAVKRSGIASVFVMHPVFEVLVDTEPPRIVIND